MTVLLLRFVVATFPTELDLSSLASKGLTPSSLKQPIQLATLAPLLRKLQSLQVLNLADNSRILAGPLPEDLADISSLKTLNISGNAGITERLPTLYAALSNLRVLDISDCSMSGGLPVSFVALQRLQVLCASGNKQLGGSLPQLYGLLQNLRVLDVASAGLSGALPLQAWSDAAGMRAAARAAMADARAAADAAAAALYEAKGSRTYPHPEANQTADTASVAAAAAAYTALANSQERRQIIAAAALQLHASNELVAALQEASKVPRTRASRLVGLAGSLEELGGCHKSFKRPVVLQLARFKSEP
jgi:hypothetical protein